MVRTVISLPEDDKTWLDKEAKKQKVPMTELIRRAVRMMRKQQEPAEVPVESLLENTSSTWAHGDGLEWQSKLRREWE